MWLWMLIFLSCLKINGAQRSLPLFDPSTCHNMCKSGSDCPANAACMPITGSSECGVCVCTFSYVPDDDVCRQRIDEEDPNEGRAAKKIRRVTSRLESVHDSEEMEVPWSWDCNVYTCSSRNARNKDAQVHLTDCSNQRSSRSKHCANLLGARQCDGGSECLSANADADFCICPYSRIGRDCRSTKPSTCKSATETSPRYVYSEKRFRHIRGRDVRGVSGRHFAPTLKVCLRLCRWAGYSRCRSVNFGQIGGRHVCELLTVWADETTPLHSWLQSDRLWTYACCFSRRSRFRARRNRSIAIRN